MNKLKQWCTAIRIENKRSEGQLALLVLSVVLLIINVIGLTLKFIK